MIGNGGQVAMTTEERSDVLTRTVEWSSGAVVMETEKETSDIQCQVSSLPKQLPLVTFFL